MRFFRMTNGFPGLSDSALLVKSKVIVAAMTGNANFPTPTPTLASLTALNDAFEEALEKATNGSRQDKAVKRQARASVISQLHLLSNYVLFTSANDEVVASSSGFSVSKPSQPRPSIEAPSGIVLENGVNRGELKIVFPTVKGANAYVAELTPSPLVPDSAWQRVESTTCKIAISGLESGKEYNCRITAIGPKAQTATSGIVSRVVL